MCCLSSVTSACAATVPTKPRDGITLIEPPDRAPAGRVLVGYSGGLDSTVLLHLLQAHHGTQVEAVHVHHGLHPDADAWARHCESCCATFGIPLHVLRVMVSHDSGHGPEQAARNARHAAIAALMQPGDSVAFAHHRDDQAETVLLRALRASGPDGLAAMRPWRNHGNGWLWRPLLDTPRADLLAYAQTHGLTWIEDPSNTDDRFDRNFLRNQVMPLLRSRWPDANGALATVARLQQQAATRLASVDATALDGVIRGDGDLDVPSLRALSPATCAGVLRRWIVARGLPPLPAEGVRRIESDLLHADAGREARFAWKDAVVVRWRDGLHAMREHAAWPEGIALQWNGRAPLALPDGRRLRLEPARGFDLPVTVRARAGGERIQLPGRTHSHALKHVLQDLGIPPWERTRLPLLFNPDGALLAAGERVLSAAFKAWLDTHGTRLAIVAD